VGGILKLEELPSLVADPMDRVHNHQVTELYPAMKQRISGETDRGETYRRMRVSACGRRGGSYASKKK
jgi:hypothetical protein